MCPQPHRPAEIVRPRRARGRAASGPRAQERIRAYSSASIVARLRPARVARARACHRGRARHRGGGAAGGARGSPRKAARRCRAAARRSMTPCRTKAATRRHTAQRGPARPTTGSAPRATSPPRADAAGAAGAALSGPSRSDRRPRRSRRSRIERAGVVTLPTCHHAHAWRQNGPRAADTLHSRSDTSRFAFLVRPVLVQA